MSSQRIGVMGGTFDPIHNGHLIMAEDALEAFGLDKILFMPSGHSYFKDHRDIRVSSPQNRFSMTELAIQGNPHFEISDMEIKREGNTYTSETMKQLKKERPDSYLYFLCGADSIAQMGTWYHPEKLFGSCHILCAVRDEEVSRKQLEEDIKILESQYGASIELLPTRNIEISSTEIRDRIREKRSVRYLIPDSVAAYIKGKGLYQ